MGERLNDDVRYVKGVGPRRSALFSQLGVHTVRDLLEHLPFRVEDYSKIVPMNRLRPGESVTVRGTVGTVAFAGSQRGRITRVGLTDGSGFAYLVWYNAPYMGSVLKKGDRVLASGKVEHRRGGFEMAHPTFRKVSPGEGMGKGPVIPVYHATAGLSSAQIGAVVKNALKEYAQFVDGAVPQRILEAEGLPSERQALQDAHTPESAETWANAMRYFAFREMYFLQVAMGLLRKDAESSPGPGPFCDFSLPDRFVSILPFALTNAQKKAIQDIKGDLSGGKLMNRLLQGDVGSGKTVVAMYALLCAAGNGFQGAILAPTEILAKQHFGTFSALAGDLVRTGYLTGAVTGKNRAQVLEKLERGDIDVLVGTHAMLQEGVSWHNLGVAVTDEQHRFGVRQRLALSSHGTVSPHVLVMSATPIPRSLALTLYGDLDITVLDELPPGRLPAKTTVLSSAQRPVAYAKVKKEAAEGRQAYVVCPVIKEGKTPKKSAEEVYEGLKKSLKGLRIGLVHGAMARQAQDEVMTSFVEGALDVLVSTTVIEVGVDVPNATCMVVEDAGSFGLATLHQLRGRVGRGRRQAYCYLISQKDGSQAQKERLAALTSTSDGFLLAEMDLMQRGPGQFFGTRQHGQDGLASLFLSGDVSLQIILKAKERAQETLEGPGEPLLREIRRRYGDVFSYGLSR